jgi:hypothetical protein
VFIIISLAFLAGSVLVVDPQKSQAYGLIDVNIFAN